MASPGTNIVRFNNCAQEMDLLLIDFAEWAWSSFSHRAKHLNLKFADLKLFQLSRLEHAYSNGRQDERIFSRSLSLASDNLK